LRIIRRMTKWRFEWVYRWCLAVCVVAALWAVYASAQTNPAPGLEAGGTNSGSIVRKLANFEELLGEHDPFFRLDRVRVLREHALFGQPYWKYLASLIYIFLAFLISKALDHLVGVWLKRWAERTTSKFDDLLLEAVRGPVKVTAFVIFLHIGLAVFQWPDKVQHFLSKGLIVIVAFSITYVLLKVVDVLMGVWRERTAIGTDKSFDEQLFPLVRKSVKLFVVVIAVLVTSQNLGINITGVIASLSIGGLALGLAAQDTLANLFGAVAVYMDKPFRIGDQIKLDAVTGTVENIGLRSTRVRNLDGHLVTIPNKTMGNAIITNITRRPAIRTEMNLGITYDTPVEKIARATAILEEIFRSHPKTADVAISFNRFADSALNILVVHVWNGTDAKEQLAGMQLLNLEIKRRFDAEGIEFAFPSQTLYAKPEK
jgi:MscS family membrane protein